MSFASPSRLVLIAVPLVLLGAYVLVQRSRRRYALRFTSVDLLASVAPRRPGWQRHVSAALMLLALLALVVGIAGPTRKERVARQRGTVMLAIDTSRSMSATDVDPSRLAAAEDAARRFVEKLPAGLEVGLLAFDSQARVLASPTLDHAAVLSAINHLAVQGGTATGDSIYQSLAAIAALPRAAGGKQPAAAIVLMSDGTPTIGRNGESPQQTVVEATAAAKRAGVPIDSIAFGTSQGTVDVQGEMVPVPADPQAMADIAAGSGGKSFTAVTGAQLNAVYDQIRKSVGYDTVPRDMTVWFMGIGLVLLVLTWGAALVWTQRLP
ncbi:MAG TPA: VWA domain-containing protein [Acidimicrobiia bacterium]|nr:VWA domain-containing protein [Acidimicrobiia bacterium]